MSVVASALPIEEFARRDTLPLVDVLRPANCPSCGNPSYPPEQSLGLVGHGTYRRRVLGLDEHPDGLLIWVRRYLCTGCGSTIYLFDTSTHAYDIESDTWTTRSPPLSTESFMRAQAILGRVILLGVSDMLQVYDTETDSWTTETSLLVPVQYPAVAAHGGFLYVFSGEHSGSIVQRYDAITQTWALLPPIPTTRTAAAAATLDDAIHVLFGATGGGSGANEALR